MQGAVDRPYFVADNELALSTGLHDGKDQRVRFKGILINSVIIEEIKTQARGAVVIILNIFTAT